MSDMNQYDATIGPLFVTGAARGSLAVRLRHRLDDLWPETLPRRAVIAASGGPDSTALAHLGAAIWPGGADSLLLAHFNHHLRGTDSDQDEEFVRGLAQTLGTSFSCGHWDPGSRSSEPRPCRNLQAGARRARYGFLTQVAREFNAPVILTAHHCEDVHESIELNLERGGGTGARIGIRDRIPMEGLWVIRPLLPFHKSKLIEFLQEGGHDSRTDASNSSTRYQRNRVRLETIPAAESADPDLLSRRMMARSESLSEEQEALAILHQLAPASFVDCFDSRMRCSIPLEPLVVQPGPIRFVMVREILRRLVPSTGGRDPMRRRPMELLNRLLDDGKDGVVNFPRGVRVEVRARSIRFESGPPVP